MAQQTPAQREQASHHAVAASGPAHPGRQHSSALQNDTKLLECQLSAAAIRPCRRADTQGSLVLTALPGPAEWEAACTTVLPVAVGLQVWFGPVQPLLSPCWPTGCLPTPGSAGVLPT